MNSIAVVVSSMRIVLPVLFAAVTVTAADVAVLPAASRATAVSVCEALLAVVVFQATEYGAVVTSAPRFAPSSLNCTPTTPTLSDALAPTVVVPDTVAPAAGAVMLTVGGVVSLKTVTVAAAAVAVLPAPSRATAVTVCGPLLARVPFPSPHDGPCTLQRPVSCPASL